MCVCDNGSSHVCHNSLTMNYDHGSLLHILLRQAVRLCSAGVDARVLDANFSDGEDTVGLYVLSQRVTAVLGGDGLVHLRKHTHTTNIKLRLEDETPVKSM